MSQYNTSQFKEQCLKGQEQILPWVGPITRTLDDSILIMKMMFNSYRECNILSLFSLCLLCYSNFLIDIHLIN